MRTGRGEGARLDSERAGKDMWLYTRFVVRRLSFGLAFVFFFGRRDAVITSRHLYLVFRRI